MTKPVLRFSAANIVFGDNPKSALPLMDAGKSREEIRKETGQVLGVHDCTLDLNEGEIVVLMGLSGSGKSTLLRASNRLNPLTRGTVEVRTENGLVDLADLSAGQLRDVRRKQISMVFQQFGLLPWRSVLENTAFGLEAAGVDKAERLEKAMKQLETVHLADWAQMQISELSGGMQQRVGLARALATEAPILLMDEPFSALDPLIRNELQEELLELLRVLDKSILFVSHDLDEAMKLGNRIAIMEGGRMVQLGTPQDIVLRPQTDYVRKFVAEMNPLGVLRAAEIMKPAEGPAPADAAVHPISTPVKELIRSHIARDGDSYISNGDQIVGKLSDKNILQALLRD